MSLRRVLVLLLLVIVLVVAAVGVAFLWLRSRGAPRRQGEARIPGLSAPVTVRWDAWGVPHLKAESGNDLAAALGYLHANDRFTQMELGRRAAAGRLSEILGRRALEIDRRFRTLRLKQVAATMWNGAGDEARGLLQAYAEGVNAWLGERAGDLPPMLRLLGVRPEPWQPQDSLAFSSLMANDLSFWQGMPEEERFLWLRQLGPERTVELLGDEALHVPQALLDLLAEARAEGEAAQPDVERPPEESGQSGAPGSNSWALGTSWTASGAPLVANDPHLPLQLPGTWYQALLRSPDYEAAGVTLPGLPGIVIGQTQHLAWAFTNTMLDDQDLFFEIVDESGLQVRRGETWQPILIEREPILLRDGSSVTVELLSTDRGPLLPPDLERRLPPRSLAWTAYEPSDPVTAMLGLARASTLEQVQEVLSSYVCPAQNLVVAHRDGGLLFTVLGRLPDRTTGDGRLPSPGWDPAYGWKGLRPRTENPTVRLPADNLLVTANHDIRPAGYALPLAADFDTPHRAERIRELLSEHRDWQADALGRVQVDVVSLYARQLVRLMADDYTGEAARAYHVLAGWSGAMQVHGPAALFALVERELRQAIFADEAERHGLRPLDSRDRLLRLLRGDMESFWFDDVRTTQKEERREVLQAALERAWADGRQRWGESVEDWDYGELHPLILRHPLGAFPVLGRWLNRGPLATPGSSTTVAAFGGGWHGDRLSVDYGPSMRWIADLADPDGSLMVLPAGQSGHPGDVHYDDQLELYLSGQLRSVSWSEEAIEASTVSTLTLRP